MPGLYVGEAVRQRALAATTANLAMTAQLQSEVRGIVRRAERSLPRDLQARPEDFDARWAAVCMHCTDGQQLSLRLPAPQCTCGGAFGTLMHGGTQAACSLLRRQAIILNFVAAVDSSCPILSMREALSCSLHTLQNSGGTE